MQKGYAAVTVCGGAFRVQTNRFVVIGNRLLVLVDAMPGTTAPIVQIGVFRIGPDRIRQFGNDSVHRRIHSSDIRRNTGAKFCDDGETDVPPSSGLVGKVIDFDTFGFSPVFMENVEQIRQVKQLSDAYHLTIEKTEVMVPYLLETTHRGHAPA